MRLFDTSIYFIDETIENYLLEVLPVNKDKWVTYPISKHFSLTLNASSLGYKKVYNEALLADLADGIYEFKISRKPNIKTVNHFYHLRIVTIMRRIHHLRAKLLHKECSISRAEYIKNREQLRDIEEYVMAAKWKVEECLDKKKGIEMYEWAKKMLEIYSNECKCN